MIYRTLIIVITLFIYGCATQDLEPSKNGSAATVSKTAEQKGETWFAAAMHLATLTPNIKYVYFWCRNLDTNKRFRCVGPQRLGLSPSVENRIQRIRRQASRKLQYGLGDLREIPTGTYQIDTLEISLGNPYDRNQGDIFEYDLVPFGIEFKLDGEFNNLGKFRIEFERDNLYRLFPNKIDVINDTQFAIAYMGEKRSKRYNKLQNEFELQNADVSIKLSSPNNFTKLTEWGVLPKLEYREKCTGLYSKAVIEDGFLILEKSDQYFIKADPIEFPSQSAARYLGCVINKYLSSTSYTEYKLSDRWEKPTSLKLVIPIEFR